MAAWSYGFSVPDESRARQLAGALADFGFPQVSAGPGRTGWQVRVVDDCRQYEGPLGYRQRDAVRRRAMAIARQHRGYPSGLTASHPAGPPSLARSSPPVLLLAPERHPPVPVIPCVPAPPPGSLSLEPDLPGLTPPDLTELRSIRWDDLDHAWLPGSLPGLIRDLVLGRLSYWDEHLGGLASSLVHQGTLYPATAPALMVLGRLTAAGSLQAIRRRDVYILLLRAAGQLRQDMIADTERALAEDRQPQPQRWAVPVREAVAAITPELLARWDSEPSAGRLALAGLAAEFPEHGALAADKIAQEADGHRGTQIGEHLMLARHLISGEATMALAAAMAIACWNKDEILANWTDDDTIAAAPRAMQILSEATPAAASPGRGG